MILLWRGMGHGMAGMGGMIHRLLMLLMLLMLLRGSRRGQQCGGKQNPVTHTQIPSTFYTIAFTSIHSAIPTIIRFSVRETKPNGTLELPPTQAHFSSRLSI